MSWPQACITGTVCPSRSVAVTVLAYGRPVCFLDRQRVHVGAQHHGRAVAVAQQADDAGLADARRHLEAGLRSRSAAMPAVRFSCIDSSGCCGTSL